MKPAYKRSVLDLFVSPTAATRVGGASGPLSRSQSIVAVGALVVVVFWIVAAFMIVHIRAEQIRDAGAELVTLNQILAADTVRIFDSTDVLLEGIVGELQDLRGVSVPSLSAIAGSTVVHNLLRDRAKNAEHIGTITILNAEGDLLAYSRERLPPAVNVIDRDYFQMMMADPQVPLVLGNPVESRYTGDLSIHLAKPLLSDSGEFIGAVVAIIPLEYFNKLYESLQIGTGGSVGLWREDGVMLARYPEFKGVGQRFNLEMFSEIVPSTVPQVYEVENALGGLEGVPRIVAAKRPEQYPLIISVTFNRDLVLAPWWSTSATILVAVSILTTLIALFVWALLRSYRDFEFLKIAVDERQQEIVKREELEEQLRQSQKLEAVGQLTAGIAHDFNNILTVVIGHMDVVRRGVGPGASPVVAKSIDRASTAARKAADLTHRLLAFARKQRLEPTSIKVDDLVEDLLGILGRTLGERVTIEVGQTDGVWPVFADRNQLENVLVNLAINSRDAMEGDGKITLRATNIHIQNRFGTDDYDGMVGDFVSLSITDTGSGMPPDVLERAFEPFYSTKGIGKGSGLGLSQVYGFSKQSGGTTRIESDLGIGTTVTVLLPRAAEEEDMIEFVDIGDYPKGARETVLVVDDNDDLLEIASTAVSELNYKVLLACDAAEALNMLRLNDVDVLLADIGLPGMSGSELGKRALAMNPAIEVIYMTGYALDEIEGDDIPPDRIMLKPFTYRSISNKLREVLKEKKRAAVKIA